VSNSVPERQAELDRLAVDTIRVLTMDAVEEANCGHPGMPMAMAPVAYALYTRCMKHIPTTPSWADRDRFILSAGHGSMLLYATLHLCGYELSLAEIKRFRQWGSRTPGHPEWTKDTLTPGVETTTGPLGQGFGNGIGMAMAERFLRERYGSEVVDHHTYAIVSDGDLMEGMSNEAASLAGHLGLSRLIYFYDDNKTTIDGSTDLSFSESVQDRFKACGWHTLTVTDANDLDAIEQAANEAKANTDQPSIISVKSVIGYPAPNLQGAAKTHGAPLGDEEVRATKELLGWDPDSKFHVPDGVYEYLSGQLEGNASVHSQWQQRFDSWSQENPELAKEWDSSTYGRAKVSLDGLLPEFNSAEDSKMATRGANGQVINAVASAIPTMIGGCADLIDSVNIRLNGESAYTRGRAGRNIFFGIREHAMGAAVNGLALHGGITKPFGATFLQFSDYMRAAVRLSALMELPAIWVYSHDSVGLGEDGPTHQPIEHLASLRAIPGLTVIRPADANEVSEMWRVVVEELDGPAALILSRQGLPIIDRTEQTKNVSRGAYTLREASGKPEAVIVGTGSEVQVALQARDQLEQEGTPTRVVSMPSWELFERQDQSYRESVLPADVKKVSVEAASSFGWSRWVDASISVDTFGASAPANKIFEEYGLTPEAVVNKVKEL